MGGSPETTEGAEQNDGEEVGACAKECAYCAHEAGSPKKGGELPQLPGVGGKKRGSEHKTSKYLAGRTDQPYSYVRMLYRGADQGVTATSESHEQQVARSKKCKTTGWQSRFAVPYRALGTPDLYLHSKKSGEDAGPGDDRGATGGTGAGGGLTAREMQMLANGVTPAGRPLNWLPESEHAMQFFGEAARRNRRTHKKLLLAQLTDSEARVKCVRAGQMATTVLAQDRLDTARPHAPEKVNSPTGAEEDGSSSTFITSAPPGSEAPDASSSHLPGGGARRPNPVPRLRLGTGASGALDDWRLTPSQITENAAQTTRSGAGGGGGGGAATARSGAATERTRAPDRDPGMACGTSVKHRQARLEAISGNISLLHPEPPLRQVAELFQQDVDALTARIVGELEGMASERLDTFRRKFKNFQLGDLGQSSERRLQAMRVCAEKEKSQAEIYLSQNRKWYGQQLATMEKASLACKVYGQLMATIGKASLESKEPASHDQRELLKGIKEMVEGGVVFDKNTVRDLLSLCTERSKAESFTSKPIQDVLDFLCERFGVVGDLYDQWVEENALPLPPSTLQRYEAARQKRIGLFKKDVVARHWRQRFDIMTTTKDLQEWLPEDVVDAVLEAQGGGVHALRGGTRSVRAPRSRRARSALEA